MQRKTPAMRYGILHEKIARDKYSKYLKANCHPEVSVTITGLHIDLKVYTLINTYYNNIFMLTILQDCWLRASPDGLVYDPSMDDPLGLLEVKCPASAKDTLLKDLCHKSQF